MVRDIVEQLNRKQLKHIDSLDQRFHELSVSSFQPLTLRLSLGSTLDQMSQEQLWALSLLPHTLR
jgi:hypothetical protein